MKAEDQVAADIARPAGQLQRPLKRLFSSRYSGVLYVGAPQSAGSRTKGGTSSGGGVPESDLQLTDSFRDKPCDSASESSFSVQQHRVIRTYLSSTGVWESCCFLCVCVSQLYNFLPVEPLCCCVSQTHCLLLVSRCAVCVEPALQLPSCGALCCVESQTQSLSSD